MCITQKEVLNGKEEAHMTRELIEEILRDIGLEPLDEEDR